MMLVRLIKINLSFFLTKKIQTLLILLSLCIGVASITIVIITGMSYKRYLSMKLTKGYDSFVQGSFLIPSEAIYELGALKNVDGIHVINNESIQFKINGYSYPSRFYSTYNSEKEMVYFNDDITSFDIVRGEYFSEYDQRIGGNVCIIDEYTESILFPYENSIGKTITLEDEETFVFTIVGVMKNSENKDNSELRGFEIIIPLLTYKQFIRYDEQPNKNILFITNDIDGLTVDLYRYFGNKDSTYYRINNITNSNELIKDNIKLLDNNNIFILLFAVVCLLNAGVGIFNTMTLAVKEREKEIGIKKAIGAKNKNILHEFLLGSILITLIGMTIGLGLGIVISYMITDIMDISLIVPFTSLILITIFTLFIGILFGLFPAYTASKLNPIILIRKE